MNVHIIRSRRRRRTVSVQVLPDKSVVLRVPLHLSNSKVNEYLVKWNQWITRHVSRITNRHVVRQYLHGDTLPYLGKTVTIFREGGSGRRAVYGRVGDENSITLPKMCNDPKGLVISCLSKAALPQIESWVREYSKRLGVSYRKLTLKEMSSRWGSCSSKRNIALNVKLLLAPASVLRYVIIHEVCHLREQNHGNRFWSLVKQLEPDYLEKKKYLRQEGANLVF